MKTIEEIRELIEEEDVEFIRLQFTDMFGNLKNMAVTPGQLDRVMNHEYSFDGIALFDEQYPYEEEVYLYPDLDSFVILPWRPQQSKVAKMICDVCLEDGSKLMLSSRTILQEALKKCKKKGYTAVVDAECEFFLFHTDDDGKPTTISHEDAGYMDVGPADLGENARREIVLNLEEMGFDVESSHHEKASAQHEIDFCGAEVSETADALMTFKFAVRSIAKRFGIYATFMPKPRTGEAGSGMHLNFSLYRDGKKVFQDEKGAISQEAKYFVGGVLCYAREMCAITNPLVNSYKRLQSGFEAPRRINWAVRGEQAAVKLHKGFGGISAELRFPDPSANPYLALTVCMLAGIRGIEEKIDPDQWMEQHSGEEALLPENLKDALALMRQSAFVREALGDEFVNIYLQVKEQEWKDYTMQVTEWEINRYLNKL